MIRLPVIGFLIFHALLSYVDSTSILPHVPGKVQPFEEHSKDAPAKKLLRADETKEKEERVGLGLITYPLNMWHEWNQYRVVKKILLPKDGLKHDSKSITAALALDDTQAVFRKFKNNEDKLLNYFMTHYDGVGLVVSVLSSAKDRLHIIGVNAKKMWGMLLTSWENRNLNYIDAFNELKLNEEVNGPLLFDGRVTFLEAYIKKMLSAKIPPNRDVSYTKVCRKLFETLEEGFGGRDKFFKLITEETQKHGKDDETKSVKTVGNYFAFLSESNELDKARDLMQTLGKVHKGWDHTYFGILSDRRHIGTI